MAKETVTKYGVARGESIVGDLFDTPETMHRHHAFIEDSMRAAGLEPDVRLVEVEVTTTTGRPRAYKEPVADEQPADEPAPDEAA